MVDHSEAPGLNASREVIATTSSGYLMLLLLLGALGLTLFGINWLASTSGDPSMMVIGLVAFLLIVPGFYMLQPNQAAAITLFGSYKGTDRATGLR